MKNYTVVGAFLVALMDATETRGFQIQLALFFSPEGHSGLIPFHLTAFALKLDVPSEFDSLSAAEKSFFEVEKMLQMWVARLTLRRL